MPASYEMSWIAKLRRWSKMYRGKRYIVSCRQLGTPETKEGSYKAANDWWRQKLAEIEGNPLQARVEPLLRTLEEQKAREQEQGLDTSALDFTLDHFKTDPLAT